MPSKPKRNCSHKCHIILSFKEKLSSKTNYTLMSAFNAVAMSNRDNRSVRRRSIIRSTGMVAVGATLMSSGVTAQKKSSNEAAKKESPDVDIQTIQSNDDNVTEKITIDEDTFAVTTYTDGKKEGKVKYTKVSSKEKKRSDITTSDIEISDEGVSSSDVNTIVDRSSQIGGLLGKDCKYDYCDDRKYEHRYSGVTFELSDDASFWSKNALTAAILSIIRNLTKLDIRSWIISSLITFITDNITGDVFTYIGKDYDGFFGPEIQHCAARGWDKDIDDVQQFLLDTVHVGGYYDSRCEY